MVMLRREVLVFFSGAGAWPPPGAGQQTSLPRIGFLHGESPALFGGFLGIFREGLKAAGFVEGENVAIEYRWAEGQNERLPALAADLVRQQVKVIAAPGSTPAAIA